MKKVVFEYSAFEDFNTWQRTDPKIQARIVVLIKDAVRSPFTGVGKPEPLRNQLAGYWSRRITDEHRLVYKPTADAIIVVSCRYHY